MSASQDNEIEDRCELARLVLNGKFAPELVKAILEGRVQIVAEPTQPEAQPETTGLVARVTLH